MSACVLVAAALIMVACSGPAGPQPASTTAAAQAGPSAAPAEAGAAATVALPTRGILLDTTRDSDDIALTVTSPVRRGRTAVATATTAPNAVCTIAVTYASGPSSAEGLRSKTTDGAGSVSWSWTVGTTTTPGTWPVEVSCSLPSGQRTVARASLVVE